MSMSTSNWYRPAALLGLLLLLVAALLGGSVTLEPQSRLFLPLAILLLGTLAFLLAAWEGCGGGKGLALALLAVGFAFLLRALLLTYVTLDYEHFLSKWVDYFRRNGGFRALKDPVGNYNVPYLYLLAFFSYLPIPDLYLIKLFSVLFDVFLAWGGMRLVQCLTLDKRAPLMTFAALLLLPTVVLNGACWGQCDSVWAAFCVHALVCVLTGRPKASLALLALAFSFKLQAIFFIPLWCIFLFTRRLKLRHLPIFPIVFLLTTVPALLAGKPMADILSVYLDQAGSSMAYVTINYNSPSVFALLPHSLELPDWGPKAFILLAFLFMFIILGLLLARRKALDSGTLTLAGAALTLGIPFLLPYMHERYFFLGGVLLVVWACAHPHRLLPAAAAELASLGGYHAFLTVRYAISLSLFGQLFTQPVEGLLMLYALCSTLRALWQRLFSPLSPEEE